MTPLLKRLEAAGLVRRSRDAADERQVRIGLTAKGRALREKARPLPHAIACAAGRAAGDVQDPKAEFIRLRDRLTAHAG